MDLLAKFGKMNLVARWPFAYTSMEAALPLLDKAAFFPRLIVFSAES